MRVVVESHSDRKCLQIGVGIYREVVGDDGLGRSGVGVDILRRCECLRDCSVVEGELLRQGIEAIEERVCAVIDADRANSRCIRVVGSDDAQFSVWALKRERVLERQARLEAELHDRYHVPRSVQEQSKEEES